MPGSLRYGGGFCGRGGIVPGNHRRGDGGRGPLRAPASLRRGAFAAVAGTAGQRDHRCFPGVHRRFGPQLAAADPDPYQRAHPPGRFDRRAADGRKDHPGVRPGAFEAHRGRGFPPGYLSGHPAGADEGQRGAAGALAAAGNRGAGRKSGPGHERSEPDGRQL